MNPRILQSLEKLDITIDRLENAVDVSLKTVPNGSIKNHSKILAKLDAMIGRLESMLES